LYNEIYLGLFGETISDKILFYPITGGELLKKEQKKRC
jgi:hypothetical protein